MLRWTAWLLQEEKGRADKVAERTRALKAARQALTEQTAAAREMRVARNRGIMRSHERLARDHLKQQDDHRTRRMEALKVGLSLFLDATDAM